MSHHFVDRSRGLGGYEEYRSVMADQKRILQVFKSSESVLFVWFSDLGPFASGPLPSCWAGRHLLCVSFFGTTLLP